MAVALSWPSTQGCLGQGMAIGWSGGQLARSSGGQVNTRGKQACSDPLAWKPVTASPAEGSNLGQLCLATEEGPN